MRRIISMGMVALAVSLGAAGFAGAMMVQAQTTDVDQERVIKVVAQRFVYSPNEIVIKKGEPVVVEFTAIDFRHGFKVPDLDLRADLPPERVTRIRIKPENVGAYDFLCDNFCGSGHEEMSGRIVVTE